MINPLTIDLNALPALSPWAIELLALRLEDDDAEQQLQRIVSSDAQLAARIIGLANSAAYGLGNVRFSTVPLALRRIGLRRAIQLSLAMLFGHPVGSRLQPQMREDLWLHSLVVATAAAEIARLRRHPEPAEAYLAGLLHDLGAMLAELSCEGMLARVRQRAMSESISIVQAELAEMGADHAHLTASLLQHWQVPEAMVEVLGGHHDPDREADSLATIVSCAEQVADLDELAGELYAGREPAFGEPAQTREDTERDFETRLALDAADLDKIVGRVVPQIAGLIDFAKVMAS